MKVFGKILPFILLLTVLIGCDKDERPDYYYRFKINGVQKEFRANKDANIVFIETGGLNTTTFTMVTGNDPEKNSLTIQLRTVEDVTQGVTYIMQEPIFVGSVLAPALTFLYLDENGKIFLGSRLQSENPGARDDGSLIFTSITTEGSYGRFEAIIFDAEDGTSDLSSRQVYTITDGEFFLPNFISLR